MENKQKRYNFHNGLWYGPVKLAYDALQQDQITPCLSEYAYLDYMRENFPEIQDGTEWITFNKFIINSPTWRGLTFPQGHFEFRLAITYLAPIPKFRNELFDLRNKITRETGWYPLVQGSRANIGQPAYLAQRRKALNARLMNRFEFRLGEFTTIRSVAASQTVDGAHRNGGVALLLEGSEGNFLLDTGFSVDLNALGRLQAVFLSHLHHDHSGGLGQILEKYNLPVILSEPTLSYIYSKLPVGSPTVQKLLSKACLIDAPAEQVLFDGKMATYPVFHSPGSYGLWLQDTRGLSVYYPGDICLKNGFMNYTDEMFRLLQDQEAAKKVVLLDCAMVRRDDYSIEVEDTPAEVLSELQQGVCRRSVFFVSLSEEASIYTYIQAFVETSHIDGKKPWMLVNDSLFNLTRRMIRPVLQHDNQRQDRFVQNLLGKGISNFIESFRVFPMSSLDLFEPSQPLLVFATKQDFIDHPKLLERLRKSDLVIVGTQALKEDTELEALASKCRVVHRVASPDWSFHSSESDMVSFITRLSDAGIRSLLFHNDSNRLKKFIRVNNLNPAMVEPVRQKGVLL